jgi:hypothetical protein
MESVVSPAAHIQAAVSFHERHISAFAYGFERKRRPIMLPQGL